MNKVFVIADIHGCYSELEKLFGKIKPDTEQDTIIFLGDYINRGPDSKKVIEMLLELKQHFQHVITLMGNHEQVLMNYLQGKDREFFLRMGGEQTLRSYGITEPWPESLAGMLPLSHVKFFQELLLYWEDKYYIYVHAGLKPGIHMSQQPLDWLLWAREEFVDLEYQYPKNVVYGHTPFEQPKIDKNKTGIDTGAVYGGYLSCLVLPERKFIRG